MGKLSIKFDFLVNLFKTSPKAFDEYHAEVVNEYIDSLPHERAERFRQYQQNLITELNECTTLEERNQRMNDLFWKQTRALSDSIEKLNAFSDR